MRELREAYSPSLDELEWARQMTGSDEALLSLTMCLKCCQRLGYFARFDEVPASITGHLRQELGLHESVNPAMVPDKTLRNHRGLVRHRLGLVSDQATARKIAAEAIRTAAEAKDNPADLINIALEELAEHEALAATPPATPAVLRRSRRQAAIQSVIVTLTPCPCPECSANWTA